MRVLCLNLARYHEADDCQNHAFDKAVLLVITYIQLSVRPVRSHQISHIVLGKKNRLLSYLVFDVQALGSRQQQLNDLKPLLLLGNQRVHFVGGELRDVLRRYLIVF